MKQVDVIIVGAGMAGLLCAHDCVTAGLSVAIVHHGHVEHSSSSSYAQGGIASAWMGEDSTKAHGVDTIGVGGGLCEPAVVDFFTDRAPDIIQFLIDLGVPFDRLSSGDYSLAKEGAHSFHRIFHVKDYTGHAMIQTVLNHLHDHPLIEWINGSLSGLLMNGSSVCGVLANNESIGSAHVVMATGGFSGLFRRSTNPTCNIGQGIALAYAAGAQLGDLEFIQYHPTVYCKDGHAPLLISEALRGEGAFLVNKNNERFMEKYHHLLDLAPRDVVARAIVQEIEPELNIAPLMTDLAYRFPTIYQQLSERGFNMNHFSIPIQPLVHYTIGGIVAGVNGVTNLNGLYAIGECALTGFHGANRLASNSLLEACVMGRECAQDIIDVGSGACLSVDHCIEGTVLSDTDLQFLGTICRNALGVIRDHDSMLAAIHELQNIDQDHPMISFVEAIVTSAFQRKENRGGHYRNDANLDRDMAAHSCIQFGQELLHCASLPAMSIPA